MQEYNKTKWVANETLVAADKLNKVENQLELLTNESIKFNSQLDETMFKIKDKIIRVEDFKCDDGKYVQGDGLHDDYSGIQKAIDYCTTNKRILVFGDNKIYGITKNILIDTQQIIIGNNSTITTLDGFTMQENLGQGNGVVTNKKGSSCVDITIKGLNILVNRKCYHGIYLYSTIKMENITIKDMKIYNPKWDGVLCHGSIAETGGNVMPYLPTQKSNRNYQVINVKCYNEYENEKTRTGIMIEHCHRSIIKDCYVTGFHSGFHLEGSSDCILENCIGEDNCGDNQENALYHSDFMIGRCENITISNCKARRINKDQEVTILGSLQPYRNLHIPNVFTKGISFIGCSFSDGYIISDEASNELYNKEGIKFNSCDFLNNNISFYSTDTSQYHKGIIFTSNSFINSSLTLVRQKGFIISNNIFNNDRLCSIDTSLCCDGVIASNTFKGGNTIDDLDWKKAQIRLSASSLITINNNNFNCADYTGSYCIGLYASNYLVMNNNTFKKIGGFAIYEIYLTPMPCTYCDASHNIFAYTSTSAEKGILLNNETCTKTNNIIYVP